MKPSSHLIAGLALVAGLAAAQPPAALRGATPDIERLVVLLDLDEYQKYEVERIFAEQSQRRRVGSLEEMQAHRRQVQQETREKLQTVLTEQQLAKFDLLMEDAGRVLMRTHPQPPPE